VSRFYRAAWIFYLVLAVGGLVGLAAQAKPIGLALFVAPVEPWIDLAAGVAVGGALLAAWSLVRRFVNAARVLEATLARLVGPLAPAEGVALALVSAIGEEVFFRGAVQSWLGLYPAAALFALLHVGPGRAFRLWTLFAVAGGLAFGALAAWRGALGAAIVAHFVVNLTQLARLARLEAERTARERQSRAV
jgi:membrane protease YdiL (CAAX protease family)